MRDFAQQIRNHDENLANMSFNLRGLYAELKDRGWDNVFEPLNDNHPVRIIHATLAGME